MRVGGQVLKGHLDTLLLACLASAPRHGYAVKEALRLGSGARFDLPTGAICPVGLDYSISPRRPAGLEILAG